MAPLHRRREKGDQIMDIVWSEKERKALESLIESQQLSVRSIIRQALALYQQHCERIHAGETMTYSGDAQRSKEFAGTTDEHTYNGPAREGIEAQRGLNDIFPGDPYPPEDSKTMAPILSPEQVAAALALAEKATPGPWGLGQATARVILSPGYFWSAAHIPHGSGPQQEPDAAFIAHARTAVPALCASHEALRKERDEAMELVEALRISEAALNNALATESNLRHKAYAERVAVAERERDEARGIK